MFILNKSAAFMDIEGGVVTIDSKDYIEFLDHDQATKKYLSLGLHTTDVEKCLREVMGSPAMEKFKVITPLSQGEGFVLYAGKEYSILIEPSGRIYLSPMSCLDGYQIMKVKRLETKLAKCTEDIVRQCDSYQTGTTSEFN